MGIELFETSAKDNINVEEMFRAVTKLVLKSKKVRVGWHFSCLHYVYFFRIKKRDLMILKSRAD